MIANYLQILQDSLVKKLNILMQIEAKSLEQADMLKLSNVSMEAIDANMDAKAKLIEQALALDEGFEHLYARIKAELVPQKEQYKQQIAEIQKLIAKVTEKSTSIQAIEARNKAEMEIYFSRQRKGLQSKRNAMSVASNYYQNMNKVKYVAPQFMDRKK